MTIPELVCFVVVVVLLVVACGHGGSRLACAHDRAVDATQALLVLGVSTSEVICVDAIGNLHVLPVVVCGAGCGCQERRVQPGDVVAPESLAQHVLAYQALLG